MGSSIYKQVRLTLTEERQRGTLGLVSHTMRIMVKPVDAEWSQRHTVVILRLEDQPALGDLPSVYRAIVDLLRQQTLPGSID